MPIAPRGLTRKSKPVKDFRRLGTTKKTRGTRKKEVMDALPEWSRTRFRRAASEAVIDDKTAKIDKTKKIKVPKKAKIKADPKPIAKDKPVRQKNLEAYASAIVEVAKKEAKKVKKDQFSPELVMERKISDVVRMWDLGEGIPSMAIFTGLKIQEVEEILARAGKSTDDKRPLVRGIFPRPGHCPYPFGPFGAEGSYWCNKPMAPGKKFCDTCETTRWSTGRHVVPKPR